MGILAKALSEQSSRAAKSTDLWPEILARVENCVLPEHLIEVERYVIGLGLTIPRPWEEPIEELIEKKRVEIENDHIGRIIREMFDFT